MNTIQSIIFDADLYDVEQVKSFITKYKYNQKMKVKREKTYRCFKIEDRDLFKKGSLRTHEIKRGIKLIIGKKK